jgi:lysophospholipase L1-like esterase
MIKIGVVLVTFVVGALSIFFVGHKLYPASILDRAYFYLVYKIPMNGSTKNPSVLAFGDSQLNRVPWTFLFPLTDVTNFGVHGENTSDVLSRLSQIEEACPGTTLIEVGINNILQGRGVEALLVDYKKILQVSSSHSKRVIAISIFPTQEVGHVEQITAANAGIRSLCQRFENCVYADVHSHLQVAGLLPEKYSHDYAHLNYWGYWTFRTAMATYLED